MSLSLWSYNGALIISEDNKVIICEACPCITVTVSDVDLMMYQDGEELEVVISNGGNYTSLDQLNTSKIQIYWGIEEGEGNGFDVLELQWSEYGFSFTNKELWELIEGDFVWRNTIRAKNNAEPGGLQLMFIYGDDFVMSPSDIGNINIGIGSMFGNVDSLHIWGLSKDLTVNVNQVQAEWFSAGLLSVDTKKDGSSVLLRNYLRYSNDTYIYFSEDWTVHEMQSTWKNKVKAIPSRASTLEMEFTYGKMDPYNLIVNMKEGVTGTISASPTRIKIDDFSRVTAELEGEGGEKIPRYPKYREVTYEYLDNEVGEILHGPGGWLSVTEYEKSIGGDSYGIIEATLSYGKADGTTGTKTAQIDIVPDEPIIDILSEPSALHVYGIDKALHVSIDHLGSYFNASEVPYSDRYLVIDYICYDDAGQEKSVSVGDVLKMKYPDDTWDDFGMGIGHWSSGEEWVYNKRVRAVSGTGVTNVVISITVYFYDETNSLKSVREYIGISIDEDINVDIDAPGGVTQDVDFTVSITVTAPSGESLPRLPGNAVTVQHGPIEDDISTSFIGDGYGSISFSPLEEGTVTKTGRVPLACTYRFRAMYRGQEEANAVVVVRKVGPFTVRDLIEACNERAVNTQVNAHKDPDYQVTWDNRVDFANFIRQATSRVNHLLDDDTQWSPLSSWKADTFEADLIATYHLVRTMDTLRGSSSGIVVNISYSRYREEQGSTRHHDFEHPQPTANKAITYAKNRSYVRAIKTKSGYFGSTYAFVEAVGGKDYDDEECTWTGFVHRISHQIIYALQTGSFVTVPVISKNKLVVKGIGTDLDGSALPKTTHGRSFPSFQGTKYTHRIPPNGGIYRKTFGSTNRVAWPGFRKSERTNTYIHRWGNTGGCGTIEQIEREPLRFEFKHG